MARWATEILHVARRRDDEGRGQGMVEYALILDLIPIVVIVILQGGRPAGEQRFLDVSNGLAS